MDTDREINNRSITKLTMYLNGKEMSEDDLERFTDLLIGVLIEQLYDRVVQDGIETVYPDDEYNQQKLLRKMEEYYVDIEQYEKCAVLTKLRK